MNKMRIDTKNLFIVLIFLVLSTACNNQAEPELPSNGNDISNSVGREYSSDGRFLIEGYDVDSEGSVSGIFPVREIRIIEVDSDQVVWKMEELVMLYQEPPFIWSPDDKYVCVAYGGRTWGSALVVNTTDMSQQQLPYLTELAPLFPDFPPRGFRPDPSIIPQQWHNEVMIEVNFTWYSENAFPYNEGRQFLGKYMFNVQTGEFTAEMAQNFS